MPIINKTVKIIKDKEDFIGSVEHVRVLASESMEVDKNKDRSTLGQYFTPQDVAKLMASMFTETEEHIRLLDAGAGVGILTAAFIEHSVNTFNKSGSRKLHSIDSTCYEIDENLKPELNRVLEGCYNYCIQNEIRFKWNVKIADFIKEVANSFTQLSFSGPIRTFNRAIMNPPYKKIAANSEYRKLLSGLGVEAGNLYTCFLSLITLLLEDGGEMVAITPRSFCNGPYFENFRKFFLERMHFKRIHVFEQRDKIFKENSVLQENIIFHVIKGIEQEKVTITSSVDADGAMSSREVPYNEVIIPGDKKRFIHIPVHELDSSIKDYWGSFNKTLDQIGISVSTGRVVDFRSTEFIYKIWRRNTMPLLYPFNIEDGSVKWPVAHIKKCNFIEYADVTKSQMFPKGYYVVTKRFSAKEEGRRIYAALYDPKEIDKEYVAFENHLNVYHQSGVGLSEEVAKGLVAYLNSSFIDRAFRIFNGHTQVNATDLRNLKYPSLEILIKIGEQINAEYANQTLIDEIIQETIMVLNPASQVSGQAAKRIGEARNILELLGFSKRQLNYRSGASLRALLNLTPEKEWSEASNPMMGISGIMKFVSDHYQMTYKTDSRESIRDESVAILVEAGMVKPNPDKPTRPRNDKNFCYQITPEALKLLRTFGTEKWDEALTEFLSSFKTLKQKYAKEREAFLVKSHSKFGHISLSPGPHSELLKQILENFCANDKFVPDSALIYVGDTAKKDRIFEKKLLSKLGVTMDPSGKFPDIIAYSKKKKWLFLIEAAANNGPVDNKRYHELIELFKDSTVKLIFVSAFPDRNKMRRFLPDIAWETHVWCADAPTHLMHFNGTKFLKPFVDE